MGVNGVKCWVALVCCCLLLCQLTTAAPADYDTSCRTVRRRRWPTHKQLHRREFIELSRCTIKRRLELGILPNLETSRS
ncbi:hypothetical protein E2C01_102526 [Portunus trituberculatus]|uniref:Secreted protein n=1 Tax=Portunus trituberculatus TaxID=210409 RepID=A0A5B7K8G9_PORTR|nr:hypothetical protein [Portunus trituberculatus]